MIDRRTLISSGLAITLGAADRAISANNSVPPPGGPKHVELRIRYVTQKAGKLVERGHEIASYDLNEDGLITFRANSHSDDPQVVRDVIYTLDRNYRPLEAFVRRQVQGRYEGSGWFRFEEGQISSETFNRLAGRQSQVTELAAPARAFVAHPVTTDVMLAAAYDRSLPRRQKLPGVFTSSADPYGRVGPSLAPSKIFLEYAGTESLQTPAGAVQTDRYDLFTAESATEPLETLWTLVDTCIFIRAQAHGQFNSSYELVEFRAT
mgnify:CR=1 FL=1